MRPLLLGMNHPKSLDPGEALAPDARGTAGARLFELVRATDPSYAIQDHLCAFERRNLVLDLRWTRGKADLARTGALRSLRETPGRTVVVLGREVRDLLGVPREWSWVLPYQHAGGWTARCLPHPSGLSRWYNDPTSRQLAGMMLLELAAASLGHQCSSSREEVVL